MLSDDDLRSMGKQDREDLLRRLVQIGDDVSLVKGRAQRERFVAITAGAAMFLLGWILYLAATLPRTYIAGHWRLTWVGFDIALAATLAATALLALWRRQLVILAAMIAGSLLFCDAWFDATTAAGSDRWLSFLSIPIEVGLGLVLLGTAAALLSHLAAAGGKDGRPQHSTFRALPGVRAGGWMSTLDALRGRQG
jgi:hypothetical protein